MSQDPKLRGLTGPVSTAAMPLDDMGNILSFASIVCVYDLSA